LDPEFSFKRKLSRVQQIFTGMKLTLRNRPDVIVFSFIGVAMRLEPGIVDLTLE